MNRLYVNDYINTLHQQISSSVDRLKTRSGSKLELAEEKKEDQSSAFSYGRVNNYAYRLLSTSVSYQLNDFNSLQEKAQNHSYAAARYEQISKVDKAPTILIDFMFKNNREFDFRV